MADTTVSQLAPSVKGNALNFVEKNGEIYFSSEEIGRHLGFKNPAKSVNRLYNRNAKELDSYAVGVTVTSTDGKSYQVRHFTEEGVYILSMLAQTPQARDFRARLARLLRELREQRLTLAREAGYQQGLDEARALPAVQAERKAGWLEGFAEGTARQKRLDGLKVLSRILGYRSKGLSFTEIGKLVGLSAGAARSRVWRARELGRLLLAERLPAGGG